MASISIIGLSGWGNLLFRGPPSVDALRPHGVGGPRPRSTPVFPCLVLIDMPVHPQFFVSPSTPDARPEPLAGARTSTSQCSPGNAG